MAKKSHRPRPKSVGTTKGKPKPTPRVSLAALSTEMLAAELRRRRSELPRLEKQAAKLRAELAAIEARMATLGGAPVEAAASVTPRTGTPRRSLQGKPTIGEHIAGILSSRGGVMRPHDIAVELGRRLSREVNANFTVQVSLTLARLVRQGRVRKIGRGQYAAGGAGIAAND